MIKLLLFLCLVIVLTSGSPRRSRGRPSSGSGATSRPRPRPTSGPRTTSKPSKYNPPKKNGWVKKAVIGAGAAYVGYKAAKATKKFGKYKFKKGKKKYKFEEWDSWRQQNGILCRDTDDCWMDEQLECSDYELVRTDIHEGWFGGDVIAIRGTCQCNDFTWWDDDDLSCLRFSSAKRILPVPLMLAIVSFSLH